ncbi:MAG: OmpA family protein [Bacteroidales bacterium]
MKKIFTLIYFFICYASIAQDKNYTILFENANYFFEKNNYSEALPLFLKLDSLNPKNFNTIYHIGICYLNLSADKDKAIPYLEKATARTSKMYSGGIDDRNAPVNALYELGRAYLINYELNKAVKVTEKYLKYLSEDENPEEIAEAKRQIANCTVAKEMIKNPVAIKVKNLGPTINTNFAEYTPVVDLNNMVLIFTARRDSNIGGLKEDGGHFFEDIYISRGITNDEWNKAINIMPPINTYDHEASLSLSSDLKQLFIYKNDNGNGNIHVSSYDNGIWAKPIKMPPPINSNSWETHACLSYDGETIFFTSNREGGFGGLDLYMSHKMTDGKWGEAINLGETINSKFNEDGPFFLSDSTLYFCSKGHNNMGGYDIFYSKMTGENEWTTPENIGYPINTTDDDLFYYPIDSLNAYFASVRSEGYGDLDIYKLSIRESSININGVIADKATKEIIPDAYLVLMNDKMKVIDRTYSDNNGHYSFAADTNTNYYIKARKESFYKGDTGISTYNVGKNKFVTADIYLSQEPHVKILVTDDIAKKPLENVNVIVNDMLLNSSDTLFTDENGQIYISLSDKKPKDILSYDLFYSKESYFSKNNSFKDFVPNAGEILIREELEKVDGVRIKGLALNKKNSVKIPGATVILMDENNNPIDSTLSDINGGFIFLAEKDKNYFLLGKKAFCTEGTNTASTFNLETTKEVTVNLLLEQETHLKILVIDALSSNPVNDASVVLKDLASNETINVRTNSYGEVLLPLDHKSIGDSLRYQLNLSKEGYKTKETVNKNVTLPGENLFSESLEKIEVFPEIVKVIEINSIFFDFDKYNIRPDAAIELDKIVKIMNEYPNMVIECGSHTDCRGSYDYNIKLSKKRAQSTANYIKQRITNPNRVSENSYGESKLINNCDCENNKISSCNEKEHQLNRRTDFFNIHFVVGKDTINPLSLGIKIINNSPLSIEMDNK